jgi:hypothetical protein
MCFSAEVSFGAAGILAIIGYQTLKISRGRWQLPLALLPSLFALHQFSEGVVWTVLGSDGTANNPLFFAAQFLYVFFAYLLFPVWMPVSVLAVETESWRRYAILGFVVLGLGVAFFNIDRLPTQQLIVKIVGHSLQYPPTDWTRGVPYILAVCFPFLLSSRKYAWLIGSAGFASLLVTFYFYYWTFASVWCFCAALISIGVYCVVRELNTKTINQT